MGRGLTVLCLVALLAGCGGDEDPPARGGVAGVQIELAPSSRGSAWANEGEVEWLGRLAGWNAELARAGGEVASFERGPRFDAVLRGEEEAVEAYARVLEPVRRCGDSFARDVGTAPSDRLADSERRFRDSCAHYREGVDLMLEAVEEQDEELAGRAREAIEEAGKQASVAAGTLPPGEKQPLPEGSEADRSRIDPTFSRAASLVADKPVEARCWTAKDWKRLMVEEKAYTRGKVNETVLGFASAGGERLNLAPQVCHSLADLAYRERRPAGEKPRFALALAAATLAHESVHAAGIADEATAECHGIQWLERTAAALGVEAGYASELRDAYWAHYDRMPALYLSAECRDGGELDLRAGSARFP
jgi:hypothetical protein